jgi:hypothetical protein
MRELSCPSCFLSRRDSGRQLQLTCEDLGAHLLGIHLEPIACGRVSVNCQSPALSSGLIMPAENGSQPE